MNNKELNHKDLYAFPLFWIKCPPIGEPIRIPDKPNIFLIPMKTPLPAEIQKNIAPAYQWTIERAIKTVLSRIGRQRQTLIIKSIELTPGGDLVPLAECILHDVYHDYCPIGDNPEFGLNKFIKLINEIPSPSYMHLVFVSCHNGYNRTGYAIAGLFMKMMKYTCRASTLLFSKKRPPGIFSQEMIDNLNKIFPADPPSVKSELPSFIRPFNCESIDNASLNQLSSITIENTPNFIYNGGSVVRDQEIINELSNLLGCIIPKKGKFHRINNGGVCPFPFMLDKKRLDKYEKEHKDLNDLKITFSPRGANLFLVVTQSQNDGFYISYDADQFYFFRALIGPQLPRPIVCTAIYTTRNSEPIIFVTDVLSFGDMYMEFLELESRLKCLWHYILPNIKVLSPSNITEDSTKNNSLVKLAYRPITKLKFATTMLNDFHDTSNFDGIPCDGATIIDRKFPVGGFLFIPLKPSLICLFIINSPETAILCLRSVDNALEYVPFTLYDFQHFPPLACLNRKCVRFEIEKTGNATKFKPISICKNAQCDYLTHANNMMEFLLNNEMDGYNIFKHLKSIVSKK